MKRFQDFDLYKKSYKQLSDFLNLKANEEIQINLRLFPIRNILKNNIREPYAKRLILTNERIIFIVNRGDGISKDFFLYNEIAEILVTKKWYISGDLPVIIIKTIGDTYEILFNTLCPYRKKIKGIIDCIKKRNPDITIEIDSKYGTNIIKDMLFTKIQ